MLPIIDGPTVQRLTPMPALISRLRAAFCSSVVAPLRHTHDFSPDASLLLMPAWQPEGRIGVKIATVHRTASPAIQASYFLIEGASGTPLAMLDGGMLTSRRTAAASALAADYLAVADARTLLVIGTGALALHLIEAHCSIRPIANVSVWGRNPAKAQLVVAEAIAMGIAARVVTDLQQAVGEADIISTATMSTTPLVSAADLRAGTHIDLVGAFRPEMAEADPGTFALAKVFVDTREGAMDEAGDLLQAIAAGTFSEADILADFPDLCRGKHVGRGADRTAITVFKSVGTALEDLAAAELVFDSWRSERT